MWCTTPSQEIATGLPLLTTRMMVHAFNQSWKIEVVDVVTSNDVWIFIANHDGHLFHNEVFSASIFVDTTRTIDHVLDPNGSTENRIIGNTRFQIVGKDTPRDLERFAFYDILKLYGHGSVNLVSTNTTVFDDTQIAFSILIVMFSLINQESINGKVHANIVIQEHAIDERDVSRVNGPSLLLQFASKGWNIERLNRFDRPYRFLTQIGPFPNRTTNIHDFRTTANNIDSSLFFIGHRLVFATLTDTCNLKGRPQS